MHCSPNQLAQTTHSDHSRHRSFFPDVSNAFHGLFKEASSRSTVSLCVSMSHSAILRRFSLFVFAKVFSHSVLFFLAHSSDQMASTALLFVRFTLLSSGVWCASLHCIVIASSLHRHCLVVFFFFACCCFRLHFTISTSNRFIWLVGSFHFPSFSNHFYGICSALPCSFRTFFSTISLSLSSALCLSFNSFHFFRFVFTPNRFSPFFVFFLFLYFTFVFFIVNSFFVFRLDLCPHPSPFEIGDLNCKRFSFPFTTLLFSHQMLSALLIFFSSLLSRSVESLLISELFYTLTASVH